MPVYRSIDRLNAMHKLFTSEGNKKLDRGEVDALAGFHKGLSKSSKGKIEGRMVEIFQESKYSKGQKDRFEGMLVSQGFDVGDLHGVDENSVDGFLKLSQGAQLDKLMSIEDEWSYDEVGFRQDIDSSAISGEAADKMWTQFETIEEEFKAEYGEEVWIETPGELQALYLEKGEGEQGKDLVGYRALIPMYTGDHDVNEAHFFNVKGEHLGSDYRGE